MDALANFVGDAVDADDDADFINRQNLKPVARRRPGVQALRRRTLRSPVRTRGGHETRETRDFIPPKPAVNHVGPTPAALKLVGCFRDEIRSNLHGVAGEPALVRVDEADSLGQ